MTDSSRKVSFLTLTIGVILIAAAAAIFLFYEYVPLRAPRAGNAGLDTNGRVVGSFRHVHGGVFVTAAGKWITLGVPSHGTGGACLLAGVDDPITGQPVKCGTEDECTAHFPRAMKGWFPYCAPEGTCWARPPTPFDQGSKRTPRDKLACNRSPEPLDATAVTGVIWPFDTDFPSNDPQDARPSRHWRVVACVNRVNGWTPWEDLPGCSGKSAWGKILTLP